MKSPYIVITGFMGCGKTEVAGYLAHQLKLPLIDLDREILRFEGHSAAELIVREGERAFREIETETLKRIFQNEKTGVIALGGGAWIEEINREIIHDAQAVSVWLNTSFDVCWQRIASSEVDRPLGRTLDQALELYERRIPIYGLAEITIKIEPGESVSSIANRIQAGLAEC